MRLAFSLLLAFLTLAPPVPSASPSRAPETGFLDRTVVLQGVTYKYQVFVPDSWTPEKKWPVILFLHGVIWRGTDGLFQTEAALAPAIRRDRERFPAIVVLPQCRKDTSWNDPPMDDLAMAALQSAQKEFGGDAERIYLTGQSMGGYGVWHLAMKYPGTFAAIVPISGGILRRNEIAALAEGDVAPYTEAARKIGARMPVWIFHGGADPVVPVTESRHMAEALKAAGAPVRYTEYPGMPHNVWDKAYAEPELFPWLLSQTLRAPAKK